jgi:hypothetical protein
VASREGLWKPCGALHCSCSTGRLGLWPVYIAKERVCIGVKAVKYIRFLVLR